MYHNLGLEGGPNFRWQYTDRRIQTRTLQILPWKGPGGDTYNVGKPSRLKIARKPVEGKVVPKLLSIQPPSGSKIAHNDVVTLTFDVKPTDVKISEFRGPARGIAPPLFKVNNNILTVTQFPPGGTTDFKISWGSGRSGKLLEYHIPAEVSIVNVNPPKNSDIDEADNIMITFDVPPQKVTAKVTFRETTYSFSFKGLRFNKGTWRISEDEMTSVLDGKVVTLNFSGKKPVWPRPVVIDVIYSGHQRPDVSYHTELWYEVTNTIPIELISIAPALVREGEPVTLTYTFNKPPPGIALLELNPFYWVFHQPIAGDIEHEMGGEDVQPDYKENSVGNNFTVTLSEGLDVPNIVEFFRRPHAAFKEEVDKKEVKGFGFYIVWPYVKDGRHFVTWKWMEHELVLK